MKNQKVKIQKLALNKESITKLSESSMKKLVGGVNKKEAFGSDITSCIVTSYSIFAC